MSALRTEGVFRDFRLRDREGLLVCFDGMRHNNLIFIFAFVGFALLSMILMGGVHADLLYASQEHSLWMSGGDFLMTMLGRPMGLLQWCGAYLTQYFYYPWVGATLLLLLWLLSAYLLHRAFRIRGLWNLVLLLPMACLLQSVVGLAYWIYCLKMPGYWFSHSLALLAVGGCVWAGRSMEGEGVWRLVARWLLLLLLSTVGWWLMGCYALMAGLLLCLCWRRSMLPGVLLLGAMPFVVWSNLYFAMRKADVLVAGFPWFEADGMMVLRPQLPFLLLVALLLLLPWVGAVSARRALSQKWGWSLSAVVLAASLSCGLWCRGTDVRFPVELRALRAADEHRWRDAFTESARLRRPTASTFMINLVARSEMQRNGVGVNMPLPDKSYPIHNPDSVGVSLQHICAPMLYVCHGHANYAIRWSVELATEYGYSPQLLKTLSRAAALAGEKELAERYLRMLHRTTFYRDWCDTVPTAMQRDYYQMINDTLDNDNGNTGQYLLMNYMF